MIANPSPVKIVAAVAVRCVATLYLCGTFVGVLSSLLGYIQMRDMNSAADISGPGYLQAFLTASLINVGIGVLVYACASFIANRLVKGSSDPDVFSATDARSIAFSAVGLILLIGAASDLTGLWMIQSHRKSSTLFSSSADQRHFLAVTIIVRALLSGLLFFQGRTLAMFWERLTKRSV